jgi:hypothetical protein
MGATAELLQMVSKIEACSNGVLQVGFWCITALKVYMCW